MKNFINKTLALLIAFTLVASLITTTHTAFACDDESGNISLLWGKDKEPEEEQVPPGLRD